MVTSFRSSSPSWSPSSAGRVRRTGLLGLLTLLLAASLALVAPAAATAAAPAVAPTPERLVGTSTVPSGWLHWQGQWFTAWIPNRKWPVVESQNGLHISSPTGTAEMSFGYATNGPAPYSLAYVRSLSLSSQAGFAQARVLKTYSVQPMAGGQSQAYVFTATRTRDRAVVKGVLQVLVVNDYGTGAYAMAAQAYVAPAAQWAAWSPTLKIITDHFAFYGHSAI